MGFSIGSFLGSIAPAIGGALLGPVGSIIGRGISGGLRGDPIGQPVGTVRAATERNGFASQVGPSAITVNRSAQLVPAQLRLPVPRAPGTPLPIPVPRLFDFNGNGPKTRLGEILDRARRATGGAVSSRKIRDAVRGCGLDTAASMFGLSVEDVCFVFIQRRRRRGGISATDLRRTRSTIRKINNMRKSLKTLRSR